MKNSRTVSLWITALSMAVLCAAQSAKPLSAPAKAAMDPLVTATKPITPKSAMPAHPKSAAVLPPTTGKNTTAELAHLENQKVSSGRTPNVSNGSAKGAPGTKRAEASEANGTAINYKYQKPAGGKQAVTPDANARNSSTPRVKKN